MKTTLLVLTVLLSTLGTSSILLFRQLSAERTRVENLQAKNLHLQSEIRRLRATLNAWFANHGMAVAVPGDAQISQLPQVTQHNPANASDSDAQQMSERAESYLRDPAMREVRRMSERRGLHIMYAELVKELELTPEQADRFLQLLIDRQMKLTDIMLSNHGSSSEVMESTMTEAMSAVNANTDMELESLLGVAHFKRYQDYQASADERMQVDALNQEFAAMSMPLQKDQRAQVFEALLEEKRRIPMPDISAGPENPFARSQPIIEWQTNFQKRYRDRVASLLTPEQLREFDERQQAEAAIMQMHAKMLGEANFEAAQP